MTVVTGLPIVYTVSQPVSLWAASSVSLWAASRFESLSKNPMILEENLPGS